MRFWPKSLAGRLAALLVLTLIAAQVVTFMLFAHERMSAFRVAYRENLLLRVASLVALLEEVQPSLHPRLIAAISSPQFRIALAREAAVEPDPEVESSSLRARFAAALRKPDDNVRISLFERPGPGANGHRHGHPHWLNLSIRLADGSWLNAFADRPPVPPLGRAFLASFLISATAVAMVGALGIRRASRPMRELARAADRLGRGEDFDPLPENGPQETRQANVAFNRMRERLERYVRDRTAMLAAIAHDLRTPITSLRLRAEFVDDEEAKARILETLTEMQAMTEAVLSFARGDAESEESRATDLTALVESVVEDAAAGGGDVRLESAPQVTLKCRPLALKRGIANLIDNATAYGTRARVALAAGEGEVRIVVDDDGPGIPAEELERVFEPFVRLEGSRSRETGGAGLGLAIARSIFRAHGGDVKLENRPGGGLRAVASLPV